MRFRTASLLAAATAFMFATSVAAYAQSGLKAIPKPSDRRPGELEGWSDTPKPQAQDARGGKKHAKAGKAAKAAKTEKPAERAVGGGIPLPNSRTDPNDYAPVGFDKNGNFSTGLKF
ncbi:MAG TPA: hypothetical protein P5256_07050 [Beijerinckiaceae bacterium]|nr:hypothetical protein [Rhodoblastus sp.]MCB9999791.1 hypothetical protein [Methylobacteriaceae bacterium]HRY02863.1 hypothetical protein [Beijerinckiaceae bacterium]MCC0001491.1 hypothetical protein [Methylobacteriaceae bacterium]MCO5088987.1 hypothetical protein [Methylobacteriaceae bacterium]